MSCFRKLAGFCFALELAVIVRWIPSEINVDPVASTILQTIETRR